MQTGQIGVQSENIFPIIKRFLYSDQEIFLRELISNAVDATQKLHVLSNKGVYKDEIGDDTIEIKLDPEAKTLTISDRGIGMTAEEVEKYLNQIAISSATEFVEKYQDSNIIGHFGLGFYSAFMVADKVEVQTKSYQGSDAVTWTCEGSPEYNLGTSDKTERGTDIILHISDDSKEFLQEARIDTLLNKYCAFLPVKIKFGTETETIESGEGDDKTTETIEKDKIINDPNPLWKQNPQDVEDQAYIDFYQQLHPYSPPPLFWIHLNIDYPFNLTGIMYFPKVTNQMEMQQNKIQLYSNQVYVTDNVKEIVPEFLQLLHGVIDSPDIPLNVSRSYLQSDSNVRKITGYITKKVADKLQELFRKDRENYQEKWNDVGLFVKYGMISDEKFYDKGVKFALLRNTDDDYFTIEEYQDKIKTNQTDKDGNQIFLYTHNPTIHSGQIKSAKARGYDVLVMDTMIDNHFLQKLEQKLPNTRFVRIDSDSIDNLIVKDEQIESVLSEDDQTKVKALFDAVVTGQNAQIDVELKAMTPEEPPIVITRPEFMRRMQEMQMMQSMGAQKSMEFLKLQVNTNHPMITTDLLSKADEDQQALTKHLFQLGMLQQNLLVGEALDEFVVNSLKMMNS